MIDWQEVSRQIGAGSHGSTKLAQEAVVAVVGADEVRAAVDWYVDGRPSGELVRCFLALLRSYAAMQRCHEIYESDDDRERRVSAIELLRFIADDRAAKWALIYLDDPDEANQSWGAGLVVELARGGCESPEVAQALQAMETASNPTFTIWLQNLRGGF